MRPLLSETLLVPVLMIVFFFLTVSCKRSSAGNDTSRFDFAYVQEDCGPTDGIVMDFYVTGKESQSGGYQEPFVQVELTANLPRSAPQSYAIQRGKGDVLASRCLKAGSCQAATSGFFNLSKFSRSVGASGDYELRFEDGSIEKGRFDAVWHRHYFLCG